MSFMRHPGVRQSAHGRLGGQVDGVLVRVLSELRHVDPEDPGVFCHLSDLRPLTAQLTGS